MTHYARPIRFTEAERAAAASILRGELEAIIDDRYQDRPHVNAAARALRKLDAAYKPPPVTREQAARWTPLMGGPR